MSFAHTQPETAALANVYLLLSRLWITEVDELVLQQFAQPPVRASWEAIAGVSLLTEELNLESLACDYCRLFVGPAQHLPPVQSVWMEGQFRGDCATSMKKYLSLLMDFTPPHGIEPDHLGLQLAVLGTILEAASRLSGDSREQSAFELADAFYGDHLTWTSPLLALAADRSQSNFYSCVIRVTKQLLAR